MIRKLNTHKMTPVSIKSKQVGQKSTPGTNEVSFNQLFQDKLQKTELQYSKHADFRMKSLGIVKNKQFQHKLQTATDKAREKNIKEGLILEDDYGFVVSVKNNTVITVVSLQDKEDKVFTNIDGAVII